MVIVRRVLLLFSFVVLPHFQTFSQENSSAGRAKLDKVAKVFEFISRNNAFVENLLSGSPNILPVGVRRVQNNMEVIVAVDKVTFHTDHTELNVMAKVVLPQKDEKGSGTTLFFGARGIKFSNDGSIIGDANLALLEDITIPFNNGNMSLVLRGDYNTNTGNSQSKTYLSVDCAGFKELGLDADLCFPTTLLEKVDHNGNSGGVVSGHFRTVIKDWNDIVASIDLPSFQICGLDGFIFDLHNVVFDFSDTRNDEAVRFPQGYEGKYLIPGAPTLWRGVYAQHLDLTLPKAFDDVNGQAIRFSADNFLIDDNGVTGLFMAENILNFESGDAGGWNFSVNTFRLELEASRLLAAGFAGEIGLPFEGEKTKFGYDALIRENNEYLMCVNPVDELDFSIFNAKATLFPNSYLTLHVVNNRFRPEAMLHGWMSIATEDEVPANIPQLDFRSLCLKTEDPYISVEYLGYTGSVTLGTASAFKVSLSNLALRSTGSGRVELASDVGVTLATDMFKGDTKLALLASLKDSNGRRKWHFEQTRLSEIRVNADIAGAIKLDGTVGWRKADPVYGDGFYGELEVTVKPCGSLRANMRGCFGSVDDYRYWFIDGSADLPVPIPVVGIVEIKGFAGAVSQKMIGTGGPAPNSNSVFSSSYYVPDRSMGLALKASVILNLAKIGSGEACFDIGFTDRGGLSYIGFYGYAQFAKTIPVPGASELTDKYNAILKREQQYAKGMSKLVELKQIELNKAAEIVLPIPGNITAGVRGTLGIQYDFRNKSLHAATELYFSTPGGFLQGVGQGGKAGWGVLHIDPSEWYMHLGAPDDRIGLMLSLGNIINIRTGAYLMAGSRIPAMPAPPVEVANILGMDLSSLTLGRNVEMLSTGKGFAFGTDLRVSTGEITFLMLYAKFTAGLGFDIMLKDYSGVVCQETGRQMGMDGWYAMGQAYAYLQGELGVKVNLWFLKTKFPIIQGGAAALLQAGLPNPGFFKGYLGVKFNLLGGLVKGNVRFKLSIGDECTPVIPGGSPLDMVMISDLAPGDNDANVSVFTVPQATFTIPLEKPFDAGDDQELHTYRVRLKSFTVLSDEGENVTGTLKWNSDKGAVSFQAKEILPPNTILRAEVQVCFDEFTGGTWKTVFTAGKEAVETKTCTFTTGGAPENIPLENVVYSYPVVDQQYFLTDESHKGFVQLQFGQKYLFEKGFDYKLNFQGDDGQEVPADYVYNEGANRLEYTIPDLQNRTGYTLMLSYTPDAGTTTTVNDVQSRELLSDEDGTVTVDTRSAEAGLNTSLQKSILDFGFATSRYATFRDKIGAVNTEGNGVAQDAYYSFRFLYDVKVDEAFDHAEVTGVDKTDGLPLIRPEAELQEPFFTQTVDPLVYDGYPFGNIRLTYRDDWEIGVPPVRSVFVYGPYLNLIADGGRPTRFYFPFAYEAGIVAEQDFLNLQSLVANNSRSVAPAILERFLTKRLPLIKYGKYKVVMRYVLPDGTVTSATDFRFNNFLELNK